MTVCIAALCGNMVVGASDRMKTAGDVEFEPPTTKILQLTNSIAVLVAGDLTFQAEILRNIQTLVNKSIAAEPLKWLSVKDIADYYVNFRNEEKLKRAESMILAPLGLDRNTFINRQKEMSESFISQITKELINFDVPTIGAIFAGVDNVGAHIYLVNDGNVNCCDGIGFCAIGIGAGHANLEFMLAGHAWNAPLPDTLLLTYLAKKRAEVAPGVGKNATDMFIIGPELGSFHVLGEHVLSKLEEIYNEHKNEEQKIVVRARTEVNRYVDEIAKATITQKQTTTAIDRGEKPNNTGAISNNSEKV